MYYEFMWARECSLLTENQYLQNSRKLEHTTVNFFQERVDIIHVGWKWIWIRFYDFPTQLSEFRRFFLLLLILHKVWSLVKFKRIFIILMCFLTLYIRTDLLEVLCRFGALKKWVFLNLRIFIFRYFLYSVKIRDSCIINIYIYMYILK